MFIGRHRQQCFEAKVKDTRGRNQNPLPRSFLLLQRLPDYSLCCTVHKTLPPTCASVNWLSLRADNGEVLADIMLSAGSPGVWDCALLCFTHRHIQQTLMSPQAHMLHRWGIHITLRLWIHLTVVHGMDIYVCFSAKINQLTKLQYIKMNAK